LRLPLHGKALALSCSLFQGDVPSSSSAAGRGVVVAQIVDCFERVIVDNGAPVEFLEISDEG
jgi:hypothetical protein